MEYFFVCLTALFASGLTLFSGFGLGTILMPAFALFFPVDIAIGLTAIVHFMNNIFKLILLGKQADKGVILKFGLPAVLGALGGAQVLSFVQDLKPLFIYEIASYAFYVTPLKLIIAFLMTAFVVLELNPRFQGFSFDQRYLPLGGVLSGFFGGISGHQGAFRSAFLIKSGLSKESFIATGVVIACLVDFSRISVYSAHFLSEGYRQNTGLLTAATLSAFAGALLGNRLLKKITFKIIQAIVSLMIFVIAILLGAGVI